MLKLSKVRWILIGIHLEKNHSESDFSDILYIVIAVVRASLFS